MSSSNSSTGGISRLLNIAHQHLPCLRPVRRLAISNGHRFLALPPYVTTSLPVDGDAAAYADGSVNIITNNFTLFIIKRHWHLFYTTINTTMSSGMYVGDGSGRGWLGVVVARKADLNWKV